jgi:hypothetical protein
MSAPGTKRARGLRSAVAALLGLLAVSSAAPARASQIVTSDCAKAGVQKASFALGDAVCVSGTLDIMPPGAQHPEADVYVVPLGSASPWNDVTQGGFDHVASALPGGAIIDAPVWAPPLRPGKYELVVDQFPFHAQGGSAFDPNRDARGFVLTVADQPLTFTCDPATIKAAAGASVPLARNIVGEVRIRQAIEDAAAFALPPDAAAQLGFTLLCKAEERAGGARGCPAPPFEWTEGAAIELLADVADALASHGTALSSLGLDATYAEVVAPDMKAVVAAGARLAPVAATPVALEAAAVGHLLAVEDAALGALTTSLARLRGAAVAKERTGLLLQSEKVKAWASLAASAGDALVVEVGALSKALDAAGLSAKAYDGAPFAKAAVDVAQAGFTQREADALHSLGVDAAMLASAEQALASQPVPSTIGHGPLLDAITAHVDSLRVALLDLVAQAEKVRAENAALGWRPGPAVSIAAPVAGEVGVAQPLVASAVTADPAPTLTYAWDTDLDGDFDDGTGPSLDYVPASPGAWLVAVKVTDGFGVSDVAAVRVDAAAAGSGPPTITAYTPADAAPFAAKGEVVSFHVDAKDPDGDALTFAWTVDGAAAGTGPDLAFTMPDEEAHRVRVVVADADPRTADASAATIVRAAKWKALLEGGTGGAGGGAAGGAGPGGSGAGGSSVGGAGGGAASAGGAGGAGNVPAGGAGAPSSDPTSDAPADAGGCALSASARGEPTWLVALALALVLRRRATRRGVAGPCT